MSRSNGARLERSLDNFTTVNKRSSPLCPYLNDEEVFKKLNTPNTLKSDWVARTHETERQARIDQDPEVQQVVIGDSKYINYSLKYKLRDHVASLFNSLAVVDTSKKESIAKTSFHCGERMQKELLLIDGSQRKRTNGDTKWGEQKARMKVLGFGDKA